MWPLTLKHRKWCFPPFPWLFFLWLELWVRIILNIIFIFQKFDRYNPEDGRITEKDFGSILLIYAGLPDSKRMRMLRRVRKKYKENPLVGIFKFGFKFDSFSFSHIVLYASTRSLIHVSYCLDLILLGAWNWILCRGGCWCLTDGCWLFLCICFCPAFPSTLATATEIYIDIIVLNNSPKEISP